MFYLLCLGVALVCNELGRDKVPLLSIVHHIYIVLSDIMFQQTLSSFQLGPQHIYPFQPFFSLKSKLPLAW